jgi:hypothetical protein
VVSDYEIVASLRVVDLSLIRADLVHCFANCVQQVFKTGLIITTLPLQKRHVRLDV